MRRFFSLALVVVFLGLSILPTAAPTAFAQAGAPKLLVTGAELRQMANDPKLVVVDMRPADQYARGHIPGAVNLPFPQLNLDDSSPGAIPPWHARATTVLGAAGIQRDNTVVAYDENGNLLATRLHWVLKYFGHERNYVLDGGLSAWTAAGGATSTEEKRVAGARYAGAPKPERMASWQYVLDRLGDPNVQIIDVRPKPFYTGAEKNQKHAGHIPTAINHDWSNNVLADAPRTFKSLAELGAMYERLGLRKDKEIIVYCTTGVQSSNTLFVLELLGYPRVKLYSGSWQEWGNRDDLPKATGDDPGLAPARPRAQPTAARPVTQLPRTGDFDPAGANLIGLGIFGAALIGVGQVVRRRRG